MKLGVLIIVTLLTGIFTGIMYFIADMPLWPTLAVGTVFYLLGCLATAFDYDRRRRRPARRTVWHESQAWYDTTDEAGHTLFRI